MRLTNKVQELYCKISFQKKILSRGKQLMRGLRYKMCPSRYELNDKEMRKLEKNLYENIERLNTECISDYYED